MSAAMTVFIKPIKKLFVQIKKELGVFLEEWKVTSIIIVLLLILLLVLIFIQEGI
jgi:hypothetical protein